MSKRAQHSGACLCGSVQYTLFGDLRPSVACHCSMCRKTSGHYWSATQVEDQNLLLTRSDTLRWFRSSDWAERGFCGQCGSSLFWRMDGEGMTSIASGTLDLPTGLTTQKHICVADKGDYYAIEAGPEQLEKW